MKDLVLILIMLVVLFFHLPQTLFPQVLDRRLEKIPAVIPSCAFQDSLGFIWIGTQEGLLRYDGYTSKNYQHIPFDSTSLSSNFILDIKGDKTGNFWVATRGGGLNYFNLRTEIFTHYLHNPNAENSLGGNTINKIIVNDDGSLWLSIFQNGFTNVKWDSLENPIYTRYMNVDKIPENIELYGLLDMYKDDRGYLWLGTVGMGLECLNIKTGERISYKHDPNNPNSISHNMVSSICEDDSGNLWLGTGFIAFGTGGGLNKFDRKTEKFSHYRYDPKESYTIGSDLITSIYLDSDNILWIGSHNKGIQKISLEKLQNNNKPQFKYVEYLQNMGFAAFYEDMQKNIWISIDGSFDIRRYDKSKNRFPYSTHNRNNPNSLKSYAVWSIFIDSKENVWFGHTTDGLSKYNPLTDRFKHYQHILGNTNSLSENFITSICEDSTGKIWLGTNNSGIDILDPEKDTFIHIKANPKDSAALYSNLVEWLLPSKSGNIWIALNTLGLQLYDFNSKKFIKYDIDTKTREDEYITSLFEDKKGSLWVGTINHGLYGVTFKNKQIIYTKHYQYDHTNRNSISNNKILDIIQPQVYDTSAMWIATNSGLNRLDLKTETFTHIQEKDGISSNYILKILEDNDGNLWFTTSVGLSKYNLHTKKIRNYGIEDGLPTVRFGTGHSNSFKDKDGRLYIAGNGVIAFDPKTIKENIFIPSVRLTDFKIFHESVKLDTAIQYKKKIAIIHDKNVFSFEFAALSFTNASQNRYSYKLEGFHDNWINTGNENTASFTNLDPGEYIFRVKGSNNDGVWNQEGASVKVIILPPWWATWLFRFIASVMIISVIIALHKMRVRYLKNERKKQEQFSKKLIQSQEEERKRIAGELHDGLGQNLMIIHNRIQYYFKGKKDLPNELEPLIPEVKETIEEVREIARNLHPHQLEQLGLTKAIQSIMRKLSRSTDIKFNTKIDFIDSSLLKENWIHIYRIVQEALTNIIKHSSATEVKIEVFKRQEKIHLLIADNGVGMETISVKSVSGFGLENLRERARLLNAKLEISSPGKKGVTIFLEIPIN